jgi:hypothetical protein
MTTETETKEKKLKKMKNQSTPSSFHLPEEVTTRHFPLASTAIVLRCQPS